MCDLICDVISCCVWYRWNQCMGLYDEIV